MHNNTNRLFNSGAQKGVLNNPAIQHEIEIPLNISSKLTSQVYIHLPKSLYEINKLFSFKGYCKEEAFAYDDMYSFIITCNKFYSQLEQGVLNDEGIKAAISKIYHKYIIDEESDNVINISWTDRKEARDNFYSYGGSHTAVIKTLTKCYDEMISLCAIKRQEQLFSAIVLHGPEIEEANQEKEETHQKTASCGCIVQ